MLAAPAWAQWQEPIPPISEPTCLPGWTAQQAPLPGVPAWMGNPMTWRCVLADDPYENTRRSTVQLSLAGPVSVSGCGASHFTTLNFRVSGGFFKAVKCGVHGLGHDRPESCLDRLVD